MEQRAHFPHDHRTEGAFQRDPQAAGLLVRADGRRRAAARKEAGGSGGQFQLVIVPEKDDPAPLHRQPYPLVMGVQGIFAFFQHKRAGRMNPGAAGLGKASGLVRSLNGEGCKLFRNGLKQIRIHGISSYEYDQI